MFRQTISQRNRPTLCLCISRRNHGVPLRDEKKLLLTFRVNSLVMLQSEFFHRTVELAHLHIENRFAGGLLRLGEGITWVPD